MQEKKSENRTVRARGLGTDLSSIFGISADFGENETDAKNVTYIRLAQIEPNRAQPRKNFDDGSLAELAESIKRNGVISPIALVKTDNGYRIIAGERRWRAAKIAGLTEIPAVIYDADEEKTAEMALVENLQREDLNPIEEAEGIRSLIDRFSLTQEECAVRLGKSRPAVANAVRLLSLDPDTLSLVREGSLSGGHGRALVAVSDASARKALADRCIAGEWNVRRLEAEIKKLSEEKYPQRRAGGVNYSSELSEKLSKFLGRGVKIISGKKKGRLELEYYGNDDLEALIGLLEALGTGQNTDSSAEDAD